MPFSDCSHVSGPSIELSRDCPDATGQVIETKLSAPPVADLSFHPFLSNDTRDTAENGEARERKKEERKLESVRWKLPAAGPLLLLSADTYRSARSAFNLRSSIGLLAGTGRMAHN